VCGKKDFFCDIVSEDHPCFVPLVPLPKFTIAFYVNPCFECSQSVGRSHSKQVVRGNEVGWGGGGGWPGRESTCPYTNPCTRDYLQTRSC